jgi:hypothetical protein
VLDSALPARRSRAKGSLTLSLWWSAQAVIGWKP